MGRLYAVVDVLALPKHRQGFPNAVLNAAGAEISAVAVLDAVEIVESIVGGENAVVVPVGEVRTPLY